MALDEQRTTRRRELLDAWSDNESLKDLIATQMRSLLEAKLMNMGAKLDAAIVNQSGAQDHAWLEYTLKDIGNATSSGKRLLPLQVARTDSVPHQRSIDAKLRSVLEETHHAKAALQEIERELAH